jgi:hypothetical protein
MLNKEAGLLNNSSYFFRQPGYPLPYAFRGWWGSSELCALDIKDVKD